MEHVPSALGAGLSPCRCHSGTQFRCRRASAQRGICRVALSDNDEVERVVIVGCAGSGKSTLARRLASISGLPVVERDGLGDENSPEFHAAIKTVVASGRWIIDGHPYYAEEIVFGAADTVVIFDLPKHVVLWRALRRTVMVELTRRPDGAHHPQGPRTLRDPEHPLRWAWTSHHARHLEGAALAVRLGKTHRIVRLRTCEEAATWLRSVEATDGRPTVAGQ